VNVVVVHSQQPTTTATLTLTIDKATNQNPAMTDKRVTMIKPVVGKVKSPAYALPESDFVYGIESKLDKEGAGEGEEYRNDAFLFNPHHHSPQQRSQIAT